MKNEDFLSIYAYCLSAVAAGYVMCRYKTVKSLKFKLKFDNEAEMTEPYINEFTRGPEDSALFFFKCPVENCIDGGYDLSLVLTDMIKEERYILRGESTCQGYNYINQKKTPCGGKVTYEVRAEYYEKKEKSFLQMLLGA